MADQRLYETPKSLMYNAAAEIAEGLDRLAEHLQHLVEVSERAGDTDMQRVAEQMHREVRTRSERLRDLIPDGWYLE